jgi:hypothetical protein
MKTTLRYLLLTLIIGFSVPTLALATCPVSNPNCNKAPEISSSASSGGLALLCCAILMLRGRRRVQK